MRNEAGHPLAPVGREQPLYSAHAIRAVAPELTTIATLLRSEHAARPAPRPPPGCSSTDMPLYQPDVERRRGELPRIRYVLDACIAPQRVK